MSEEYNWLQAARQGDADAFEQLVLRYQDKVYHLALRSCGSPQDAEEIAQEAFLSAWKGLPAFRGEAAFSTWLYRLTLNACSDHFRRQKGQGAPLSLDDEQLRLDIPDQGRQPQELVEEKERQEMVQKALLSLSPEHRQVLLLRELQQLSYQEIAQALEMDPGTVKSRIHRARNQLREILLRQGTFFTPPPSKDADETKQEGRKK